MAQANGLKAAIMDAAKGEQGLITSGLKGYSMKQVSRGVQKLCEAGLLFGAKLHPRRVHYFDSMRRAEEFEVAHKGKPIPGITVKRSSAWDADMPMVVPVGVEVFVDQAPVERFAPDAQSVDWRKFSSLRPGQYIAEPSTWVKAVAREAA